MAARTAQISTPLLSLWADELPADNRPEKSARQLWPCGLGQCRQTVLRTADHWRSATARKQGIPGDSQGSHQPVRGKEHQILGGSKRRRRTQIYRCFLLFRRAEQGPPWRSSSAHAYKIEGVPALAVNGKYLIGTLQFEQQLAVADKIDCAGAPHHG